MCISIHSMYLHPLVNTKVWLKLTPKTCQLCELWAARVCYSHLSDKGVCLVSVFLLNIDTRELIDGCINHNVFVRISLLFCLKVCTFQTVNGSMNEATAREEKDS
jgi:hypothetical protein